MVHFTVPTVQEYSAVFAGAGTNPGEQTLEDKFFEKEVSLEWPETVKKNVFITLFPPP